MGEVVVKTFTVDLSDAVGAEKEQLKANGSLEGAEISMAETVAETVNSSEDSFTDLETANTNSAASLEDVQAMQKAAKDMGRSSDKALMMTKKMHTNLAEKFDDLKDGINAKDELLAERFTELILRQTKKEEEDEAAFSDVLGLMQENKEENSANQDAMLGAVGDLSNKMDQGFAAAKAQGEGTHARLDNLEKMTAQCLQNQQQMMATNQDTNAKVQTMHSAHVEKEERKGKTLLRRMANSVSRQP